MSYQKQKNKKTINLLISSRHTYLSSDSPRWRRGDRSFRPTCEWRALCSCPVCEPTHPLAGHSSTATTRTRRCGPRLKRQTYWWWMSGGTNVWVLYYCTLLELFGVFYDDFSPWCPTFENRSVLSSLKLGKRVLSGFFSTSSDDNVKWLRTWRTDELKSWRLIRQNKISSGLVVSEWGCSGCWLLTC